MELSKCAQALDPDIQSQFPDYANLLKFYIKKEHDGSFLFG